VHAARGTFNRMNLFSKSGSETDGSVARESRAEERTSCSLDDLGSSRSSVVLSVDGGTSGR
jgi:hypothetical protein